MRSILVTIALIISTLLFAPTANAQPGCTGPTTPGPVGPITTVWCLPPVPTGQHMRCEWKFFFNACDWRWEDNSIAPAP